MIREHYFCVATLPFSVTLPYGLDVEALLPSFRPFHRTVCTDEALIFRLTATTQSFADDRRGAELLDDFHSDMGHVSLLRTGPTYHIDIDYRHTGTVHTMTVDSTFSRATAYLRPADPCLGAILSSMIRILYAQTILRHGGISIHASCVSMEDRGYLFLGKSGTGKSTHAHQWMEAFPGCTLLNDDNPVLRLTGDRTVMVYGTPWSGKTPCYRNVSCPVSGIIRLQQSPENHFHPLDGPEAFAALLPSCSAIRQDSALQEALHTTLIHITEQVRIGRMQCRPDTEAAHLCLHGLLSMEDDAHHQGDRPTSPPGINFTSTGITAL